MTTATKTPILRLSTYVNKHGYKFQAVEIDGVLVSFTKKDYKDRRSYNSNTRVFGAADALVKDLNAIEPEWVSEPKGVETDDVTRLKGKIWRTWRDGTKKVAGERLSALLDKLIEARVENAGFGALTSTESTFSYKAGCSCGCSPGFILGAQVMFGNAPADISISDPEGLTKLEATLVGIDAKDIRKGDYLPGQGLVTGVGPIREDNSITVRLHDDNAGGPSAFSISGDAYLRVERVQE